VQIKFGCGLDSRIYSILYKNSNKLYYRVYVIALRNPFPDIYKISRMDYFKFKIFKAMYIPFWILFQAQSCETYLFIYFHMSMQYSSYKYNYHLLYEYLDTVRSKDMSCR
jgi:hypothetical protein